MPTGPGAQLGSSEDNEKLGGRATGAQDWREKWLIKALEDDIPMALELVQCHRCPDRPWPPSLPGTADPGRGACLLPSLHSVLHSALNFWWKRKIGSISVPCRHGLTSFLFSRPSVLALDRLYFILKPRPGRKLATSYLFIFLSLGPKFLNLEDMGAGCS